MHSEKPGRIRSAYRSEGAEPDSAPTRQPLRMPHCTPAELMMRVQQNLPAAHPVSNTAVNNSSAAIPEIVANDSSTDQTISTQSTLSPYAEVFVPRQSLRYEVETNENLGSGECHSIDEDSCDYPISDSVFSVSDRLRIYRPNLNNVQECEAYLASDNIEPMDKLNQAIDMLRENDANFKTIQGPILKVAADVAKDKPFLKIVVRLILNETIHKNDFCYNGARICVLLDRKIPNFHLMVIKQCATYIADYTDPHKHSTLSDGFIRGLISSMGELYFQFITERHLKLEDLTICSTALFKAMNVMVALDEDKDLNIKTVCQALKLTGYHLQLANPLATANLLSDLEIVTKNDEDLAARARAIMRLRNSGWGYEEQSSETNQATSNDDDRSCLTDTWDADGSDIDDTVYYGPDGKVMTAEETSFLYCHIADISDSNNGTDDEDTLWDPENELGPDVQEAFKEFLKFGKKKHD